MLYLNCTNIKQKVLEVYKECDIHSFPVDCFSLLEHYKFRLISYQQIREENSELYLAISNYSKDAITFRTTIYYNSLNTDRRIRFSLMHELGHFILGHTSTTAEFEDEADVFASNILAPRVAIKRLNCETADDIHDIFKLSYSASNRALQDYKRWILQEQCEADSELNTWLYYPNFYRHRENRKKNKEKESNSSKRAWKKINKRNIFVSQHISNYDDYIFNEYEKTNLYNL